MNLKKSLLFLTILNIRFVRAHGIGESFEGLTNFFIIPLIFGGIEKSIHLYNGIPLDEVAGFIVHVIFWAISMYLLFNGIKKINSSLKFKYALLISIITTIILSHLQIIYFLVFLTEKLTNFSGDYAGIISMILSYSIFLIIARLINKNKNSK